MSRVELMEIFVDRLGVKPIREQPITRFCKYSQEWFSPQKILSIKNWFNAIWRIFCGKFSVEMEAKLIRKTRNFTQRCVTNSNCVFSD